jgi:ferrochelatase
VYQSQGADGGDWLGPDLETKFQAVRRSGKRQVIVVPIGFLSDHVETLYDLDIEARGVAERLGLAFTRVPALNDDAGLIEAMAGVATQARAGSDPS